MKTIQSKAMKYDWCKEHGEFFCAIKDENIVAVAGCPSASEVSENVRRILFRGCELPKMILSQRLR